MATFIVTNTGDSGQNFYPRMSGSGSSFPTSITTPSGDFTGPSLAMRSSVWGAYAPGERQYRATSYLTGGLADPNLRLDE
jgi:hypothetical protein